MSEREYRGERGYSPRPALRLPLGAPHQTPQFPYPFASRRCGLREQFLSNCCWLYMAYTLAHTHARDMGHMNKIPFFSSVFNNKNKNNNNTRYAGVHTTSSNPSLGYQGCIIKINLQTVYARPLENNKRKIVIFTSDGAGHHIRGRSPTKNSMQFKKKRTKKTKPNREKKRDAKRCTLKRFAVFHKVVMMEYEEMMMIRWSVYLDGPFGVD